MVRTIFTKIIFFLLIASIIGTVFFLAFGTYRTLDQSWVVEEYYTESGTHVTITHDQSGPKVALLICTPINFVFTASLFIYWRHRKKYDRIMEELPVYLELYRRIKLEEVAQRLGITMKELDTGFRKCIKKGTIQGSIDNSTGEFVLSGVKYQKVSMYCSNCGAKIEKTFLEGEIIRCEYCGVNL